MALDPAMLQGMLNLANAGFTFTVSEIAGGVHSANSRHYAGVAFDVNVLNGSAVNASNTSVDSFKTNGAAQGATEVLGPGDPGHATHVHLGWPRPGPAIAAEGSTRGLIYSRSTRPADHPGVNSAASPRGSSSTDPAGDEFPDK